MRSIQNIVESCNQNNTLNDKDNHDNQAFFVLSSCYRRFAPLCGRIVGAEARLDGNNEKDDDGWQEEEVNVVVVQERWVQQR